MSRFPLLVGLGHEVDERDSRGHGKARMPWLQPAMLSVASVTGAVEPAELRKVVRELREVAQNQLDVLGALDRREAGAREAGKFRQEGKEYVVQDGDVMNFRFNV